MFKPAARKGTFVLVGLTGQSGTGKTYSALRVARGLAGEGKIAFLDTENGRGAMYAGDTPEGGVRMEYDTAELHAPFTPARYTEVIQAAEQAGASVLIIDSFSHEWEGTGGVLERAEEAKARTRNQFAAWREPKMEHKKLVNAILQARMHVIICMRGKVKRVQQGKEIIDQGIVPIQDERFIYEMTVSLIMGDDQTPTVQKCPSGLAFQTGRKLTEKDGAAIRAWAGEAVDAELDQAVSKAREAAGEGSVALRDCFYGFQSTTGLVGKLKAIPGLMEQLQAAAAEADRIIAGDTVDNPVGDNLDDQEPGI